VTIGKYAIKSIVYQTFSDLSATLLASGLSPINSWDDPTGSVNERMFIFKDLIIRTTVLSLAQCIH
jgi:hypothetical protein